MIDLVFYASQASIAKRAKELGWKDIVWMFGKDSYFSKEAEKVENRALFLDVKKPSDLKVLRKVKKHDLVVVKSNGAEDVNDAIVSSKEIDIFLDLATVTGRDHTHYRRSGVNQVIAKNAFKNKQVYAINFARILKYENDKRAKLLGRVMQNIRIMQKYKVPIMITSMAKDSYGLRKPKDLVAFSKVLSVKASTKSVIILGDLLKKKQDIKSGKIVREGVRLLLD